METPTIKFKYIFDDAYEPDYVNGVYGGVNPNGELIMNFFMDRQTIPYEITNSINEDGSLNQEPMEVQPNENKMRRVIKSGVVVNRDTAYSLYRWIKERLVEMGMNEDEL